MKTGPTSFHLLEKQRGYINPRRMLKKLYFRGMLLEFNYFFDRFKFRISSKRLVYYLLGIVFTEKHFLALKKYLCCLILHYILKELYF